MLQRIQTLSLDDDTAAMVHMAKHDDANFRAALCKWFRDRGA